MKSRGRPGFTLIELLVVLGIVALLLALLMPALSRSRRQAQALVCQSNLRQLGHMLQIYSGENGGWLFPVTKDPWSGELRVDGLGTAVAPHLRWPMRVFKVAGAPNPPPYGDSY